MHAREMKHNMARNDHPQKREIGSDQQSKAKSKKCWRQLRPAEHGHGAGPPPPLSVSKLHVHVSYFVARVPMECSEANYCGRSRCDEGSVPSKGRILE